MKLEDERYKISYGRIISGWVEFVQHAVVVVIAVDKYDCDIRNVTI